MLGWVLWGALLSSASADTLRVAGLRQPVEVRIDRWGIPHIYAQTEWDLFFAQGYQAARDRLFQLELWRRKATGTLAEAFGPRFVPYDHAARLLRFRGPLEQELRHYHERGPEIIRAFVAGINARIREVLADTAQLPLEFRLLGFRPGFWTEEVVISRHNGLYGNVTQEVQIAQLVAALGPERARELLELEPAAPSLEPDSALDLQAIRPEILRLYRLYRAPVLFEPEDVQASYRAQDAQGRRAGSEEGLDGWEASVAGSNNWAVSGALSLSRRPLLANDPHRAIQIPSLRYWVHLVGPGWNVIGAGEPALPGVAIGHNEYGAWGLTVFGMDMEDLYVYALHPEDLKGRTPPRYRYQNRWEPMHAIRDTIRVRGAEPVVVELLYTRHGPVLHVDSLRRRAYALRAAWLEVGAAPYLASLRINQARSWEEFQAACRYFRTPPENLIWADRSGRIGWQAVGIVPVRRSGSGLLPVPGDGRYEWEGFLAPEFLPYEVDPPRGWIATANEENLPARYPIATAYSWAEPFRMARIQEVLSQNRRFDVADLAALQHDVLAIPARLLVPLLSGVAVPERLRWAQAELLGWDLRLEPESRAAALYVAWERALLRRLSERLLPEPARSILGTVSLRRLIRALWAPDGTFGPDPIQGRDAVLLGALEEAVRELEGRFGPDRRSWRYGSPRMKHVWIRHPLSAAVREPYRSQLDVGPAPRGGYAHTVLATGSGLNQNHGASFRILVDTADWDRALGTSTPGQSGDPASPHYRDLFPLWASGRYFPVFFSRERVLSVTAYTRVLLPP
ncbi:MAG: penicillin acylase family protein [Bacteroidota bacterium]|nr:penicillin acylase family protein [Bacteroidota bacterium]